MVCPSFRFPKLLNNHTHVALHFDPNSIVILHAFSTDYFAHCCTLNNSFYSTLTEVEASFVVPLRDQIVKEENDVTLECQLSKPNQAVKWYKNDTEVVPTEDVEVIAEGPIHKLVLKNAKPEDAAQYSVRLGAVTTEADLTVEGMNLELKHPGSLSKPACCSKNIIPISRQFSYHISLRHVKI